jgi:AraC family transcriptional regulator
MLLVLHDATLKQASASVLFGELIANAIAVHLMTTFADREFAHPVYRGGIPRSSLTRVLERIETHVQGPLPVSELAEAAGLSVFHFGRAFRQSMGSSPYQYLLARRIEHAKSLLPDSDKSVAQVAASVGFAQQNHFSHVFKKHMGFSPNEFRRRSSEVTGPKESL